MEAAYKKQYPEPGQEPVAQGDAAKQGDGAKDDGQQSQAQPVEVNWADPKDTEVSPEVAGIRQGLQTYFGEIGLNSQQATGLIATARKYSTATVSDSEVFSKQRASESALKAEWGDAFEANARAIRSVINDFEKRFNHPDLDAARASRAESWLGIVSQAAEFHSPPLPGSHTQTTTSFLPGGDT